MKCVDLSLKYSKVNNVPSMKPLNAPPRMASTQMRFQHVLMSRMARKTFTLMSFRLSRWKSTQRKLFIEEK